MPTFEFIGRDSGGKLISGKRIAHSADTISGQLIKEGIIPTKITLVNEEEGALRTLTALWSGGKVTPEEIGMFARQMHTLTKTGVPITIAIKRLAETARSPQMTTALNGISEGLESGIDLASAMQRYPKIFNPLMIGMIRVGESSGSLDLAFLRLNQYIELETSAMKSVSAALRYPTFIFFTMVVAVIVINVFVIPTFASVFAKANIPLPAMTKVLIAISDFSRKYGIYLLVIIGLSIYGGITYFRTPEGRLLWDRTLLKIPVLGTLLKRIVLLRFTQVFAIIVDSGVPLLEGLTLVSQATNNSYVRQEIVSMRESIKRGNSLTQAATTVDFFTSLEIQMLAVSEETGDLGEMLKQISVFYQREVEYDLKRLNSYIEPILILFLSGMVLLLAFAVYLPIWNMIKLAHV